MPGTPTQTIAATIRSTLVLSLVSFILFPLIAQEKLIPFHNPGINDNIDYHSFHPSLMLSFTIGETFQKLPKNPVLRPTANSWDSRDVADPFVLVTADSIYLFYDGDSRDKYQVGYAVRDATGWFWEKRGVILKAGGQTWDGFHQIAPVVLPTADRWLMFYNGNYRDEELGYQWGLATRSGKRGTFYARPAPAIAIDTTAWDFAGNAYGDVLFFPEENLYRMWYTGFQGPVASIGMAESPDGYRWQKRGSGATFMSLPGVTAPEVIYNGSSYTMFFVQLTVGERGARTHIRRAESTDGIRWENIRDVLRPDRKWERRRLMRPSLAYFEGRMQLYYCGGGGKWRIGAAYSEATFQPQGRWRSAPLNPAGGTLLVKYELPAGSSIELSLLGIGPGATGTVKVFSTELNTDARQLRAGVYAAEFPLPPGLAGKTWHVELDLQTQDTRRTPVVYSISLK